MSSIHFMSVTPRGELVCLLGFLVLKALPALALPPKIEENKEND